MADDANFSRGRLRLAAFLRAVERGTTRPARLKMYRCRQPQYELSTSFCVDDNVADASIESCTDHASAHATGALQHDLPLGQEAQHLVIAAASRHQTIPSHFELRTNDPPGLDEVDVSSHHPQRHLHAKLQSLKDSTNLTRQYENPDRRLQGHLTVVQDPPTSVFKIRPRAQGKFNRGRKVLNKRSPFHELVLSRTTPEIGLPPPNDMFPCTTSNITDKDTFIESIRSTSRMKNADVTSTSEEGIRNINRSQPIENLHLDSVYAKTSRLRRTVLIRQNHNASPETPLKTNKSRNQLGLVMRSGALPTPSATSNNESYYTSTMDQQVADIRVSDQLERIYSQDRKATHEWSSANPLFAPKAAQGIEEPTPAPLTESLLGALSEAPERKHVLFKL